jgi:Cytochrome P450
MVPCCAYRFLIFRLSWCEINRGHFVALPHVTTEDDEYEGYSIPANSTVIPNSWLVPLDSCARCDILFLCRRILNDPEMYPNPSAFLPERFLPDKNGHVARDPAIAGAFGFGRRSVSTSRCCHKNRISDIGMAQYLRRYSPC